MEGSSPRYGSISHGQRNQVGLTREPKARDGVASGGTGAGLLVRLKQKVVALNATQDDRIQWNGSKERCCKTTSGSECAGPRFFLIVFAKGNEVPSLF